MPRCDYALPERDDPSFDWAAATALLEAARVGETQLAERATGHYWGEPRLKPHVAVLLAKAERGLFLVTLHPHVSGHRSRIVALELLIAHIRRSPGVWYATHAQVADYVRAQAGMR